MPGSIPHIQQVTGILRQASRLSVDAVVFPEAWLPVAGTHGSAVGDAVAHIVEPLLREGIRCFVGVEANGRQIAVDAGETGSPYVKHSSADHVAFQNPGWSRSGSFPIWQGGVGALICHDIYLSLLAHQFRARGARIYLNPTGSGVVALKWTNVLTGRALEVGAPIACTMSASSKGATACWVIAASGGRLTLRAVDGICTNEGREPGRLYAADLAEDAEMPPPCQGCPAGGAAGLPVSVTGDRLHIGAESICWGAGSRIQGFDLVSLDESGVREPCLWAEPLIRSRGKCLYWLRVTRERYPAALAIAKAKAVELCCPVVIESEQHPLALVELHNRSKGVRVNSPPTLQTRFQTGFRSSFKMLRGRNEPPGALQANLDRYRTLLWSCRP